MATHNQGKDFVWGGGGSCMLALILVMSKVQTLGAGLNIAIKVMYTEHLAGK